MTTTILDPPRRMDATTFEVPRQVRIRVGPDDFAALCAANPDLRLEREADGGVIVMSPASSRGGRRNLTLGARLWNWNESSGLGVGFDSSTGFTLPDGSIRAPDAAWTLRDRWERLTPEEQDRFAPIVPDFVAELRSPSDTLPELRAKMRHYVAQGVRLAWLIDPATRTVEVYRPDCEVKILAGPTTIDGGEVLPGFTLDLKGILSD